MDRPQPKLRELAELLTDLTASVHRIHDVSIYSRRHKEAPWNRLRLDENDVLRAAPVSLPFLKHICSQEEDGALMVVADSADLGLEAVQLTNTYLARHHGEEGMFATLFFGVLDPASGRLHDINGGHEPLFVVGQGGIKSELPPTGPAVGAMEGVDFSIGSLQLAPAICSWASPTG